MFENNQGSSAGGTIIQIIGNSLGKGYWLVAADGGVFTFGDATFYGSTGGIHLNQPIVAILAATQGDGYILVAKDGGVFAFGQTDAPNATPQSSTPIVGVAMGHDGAGGWLVGANGTIYNSIGSEGFYGPNIAPTLQYPIVGIAGG